MSRKKRHAGIRPAGSHVFLLAAGFSAIQRFLESGTKIRGSAVLLALLCVAGSAGFVDFAAHDEINLPLIGDASKRMLFLAALVVPIAAIWLTDCRHLRRPGVVGLAVIFVLALAALHTGNRVVLFALPCMVAMLVYLVNTDPRLKDITSASTTDERVIDGVAPG